MIILDTLHGRGKTHKYRNTNTLSIHRPSIPAVGSSSSRPLYTFQLISEKRRPTSGLFPLHVEGGHRPFARRNITSLELVWSSVLMNLRYRARECSGLQPRRGACHVHWTITLFLISESCGSSGSCHLLSTGTWIQLTDSESMVND